MSGPRLSMDVSDPAQVPYFNWDVRITNAQLRETLLSGSDAERLPWIARIMREARIEDVWSYVSLRKDVLPNWDRLAWRLGRRRRLWEFLIREWRHDGLIP